MSQKELKKGITPAGLRKVETVGHQSYWENIALFKRSLSAHIGDGPTAILVPLNGGLVPLYHALSAFKRPNTQYATRFIPVAKDASEKWYSLSHLNEEERLVVIDDIADTGSTLGQMRDQLGRDLSLVAMTRRINTPKYTGNYEDAPVIPNRSDGTPPWILSGYGMNSNKTDRPYLKALERWAECMLCGESEDRIALPYDYEDYLAGCLTLPSTNDIWFSTQIALEKETDAHAKLRVAAELMNLLHRY